MNTVFVYETLLDERIIKQAIGREIILTPLVVRGVKEVAKNISKSETNYHTLISSPNSSVEGAAFEVTDEELDRLDKWENFYRRIELRLKDNTKVYTYVLKEKHHDSKD